MAMFLFFLMGGTFAYIGYKEKKYTKPSHLFLWYWLINIFVGLLVFNTSWKWNGGAFIYIMMLLAVFNLAERMGERVVLKKNNKVKDEYQIDKKKAFMVWLFCFILAILYVLLEILQNGFSISDIINNIFSVSSFFSDARYGTTEIVESTVAQICLSFCYAGFIVNGYLYNRKIVSFKYVIIYFLPMIIEMLFTSGKTGVVSGILLCVSGYLVGYCVTKEWFKINYKLLMRIMLVGSVLLVAIYYSFYFRYGGSTYTNIIDRIIIYAVGHVPCLDNWFIEHEMSLFGYGKGYRTFMVVAKLFDYKPENLLQHDLRIDTIYGWTNVPSSFYDYLYDFGYIGTIIFFVVLGFITGIAYKNVTTKCSAVAHAFMAGIYYCIVYSFIVSPLRYTSIMLAFLIFGIFVWFFKGRKCN